MDAYPVIETRSDPDLGLVLKYGQIRIRIRLKLNRNRNPILQKTDHGNGLQKARFGSISPKIQPGSDSRLKTDPNLFV